MRKLTLLLSLLVFVLTACTTPKPRVVAPAVMPHESYACIRIVDDFEPIIIAELRQ